MSVALSLNEECVPKPFAEGTRSEGTSCHWSPQTPRHSATDTSHDCAVHITVTDTSHDCAVHITVTPEIRPSALVFSCVLFLVGLFDAAFRIVSDRLPSRFPTRREWRCWSRLPLICPPSACLLTGWRTRRLQGPPEGAS